MDLYITDIYHLYPDNNNKNESLYPDLPVNDWKTNNYLKALGMNVKGSASTTSNCFVLSSSKLTTSG